MKKIFAMILSVVLLLGACSAGQKADGALDEGVRVIELVKGFSGASIHAYRGETVALVYTGDGDVWLSVPEFGAEQNGSGEVRVEFKATKMGSFDVIAKADDGTESGTLIIEELSETNVYKSVDAAGFEAAMTGEYLLLDVRTQGEYDAGYIDGAILIPHTELADRLDEVEGYEKVLVYCASGNRSVAASQILIDAGFKEVYNFEGGYAAWQAYKQP